MNNQRSIWCRCSSGARPGWSSSFSSAWYRRWCRWPGGSHWRPLMLMAYALARRRPLRFPPREHAWIALQGVLLFGLNYIGVYLSEQYLDLRAGGSGVFAGGVRQFARPAGCSSACRSVPTRCWPQPLGVAGVALIFGRELLALRAGAADQLRGLVLALGATLVASLGNMVASRNQRHGLPVLQVNAWSMLYGAAVRRRRGARERRSRSASNSPGPTSPHCCSWHCSVRRWPSAPT